MIINVIIVNKKKIFQGLHFSGQLCTKKSSIPNWLLSITLNTFSASLTVGGSVPGSNVAGNVIPGRGSRNLLGVDSLLNSMNVPCFVSIHT